MAVPLLRDVPEIQVDDLPEWVRPALMPAPLDRMSDAELVQRATALMYVCHLPQDELRELVWRDYPCDGHLQQAMLQCPAETVKTDTAAASGDFRLVKWLHARASSHPEMLRWVIAHGCPWHEDATLTLISRGDDASLRWAIRQGCPWYTSACTLIMTRFGVDMLRWALDRGCPWMPAVTTKLVDAKCWQTLRWCIAHGFPLQWNEKYYTTLDKEIFIMAAQYGDVDYGLSIWFADRGEFVALRWLIERGVPGIKGNIGLCGPTWQCGDAKMAGCTWVRVVHTGQSTLSRCHLGVPERQS